MQKNRLILKFILLILVLIMLFLLCYEAVKIRTTSRKHHALDKSKIDIIELENAIKLWLNEYKINLNSDKDIILSDTQQEKLIRLLQGDVTANISIGDKNYSNPKGIFFLKTLLKKKNAVFVNKFDDPFKIILDSDNNKRIDLNLFISKEKFLEKFTNTVAIFIDGEKTIDLNKGKILGNWVQKKVPVQVNN